MSFLGVLNLRWTSLGPLSSTKFVSTVTSSAGAWLANRLEFWEKYKWQMLVGKNTSLIPWIELQSLSWGRFPGYPSCWGCQRQREERPQLKLYCQWRCQHSTLPDDDRYRWCFFKDSRLQLGTSSPAGRLQGFLSIKSRLVPTQREGILNKQLVQGIPSILNELYLSSYLSCDSTQRSVTLQNATTFQAIFWCPRISWEYLQVPDTPVRVLQPVPSTVNAELVWPDEEEEEEEEEEVALELPEFEICLSLGQPAEQCPHCPVPVTWFPPTSTLVLHQNLP